MSTGSKSLNDLVHEMCIDSDVASREFTSLRTKAMLYDSHIADEPRRLALGEALDNRIRAAEWLRTIDGDTFAAMIIVAPGVKPNPRLLANVRVHDWNAAELSEAEGPFMRDAFNAELMNAKAITIRLLVMSFERIVCDVWIDGHLFSGILKARLTAFRKTREGS